MKLWLPFDRRLILTAVRTWSGALIYESEAMQADLGKYWSTQFTYRPSDTDLAQQVLRNHAAPLDTWPLSPPTTRLLQKTAERAAATAPGPDGIPYAAYANAAGAAMLYFVQLELLAGKWLPISFNASLTVFPPKGSEEDDHVQVTRTPDCVRPLQLKNTDNKNIAAANNHELSRTTSVSVSTLQNGFIRGRQLLGNVADLDAASHVASFAVYRGRFALLILFDIAAAFPSLAHDWLFATLTAMQMPSGFFNLISCMYTVNCSFGVRSGQDLPLFLIMCGVMQGCPLSGTLFALALNPFLVWLGTALEVPQLGTVRACADDIGVVLNDIQTVPTLAGITDTMGKAARLHLKTCKCKIIPLWRAFSPQVVETVQTYLFQHVASWCSFQVVASATYLGFVLGPGAGFESWLAPLQKWRRRVLQINSSQAGPTLNLRAYSIRALSTLGYIAQLLPLPGEIKRGEILASHRVLHSPNNSFTAEILSQFSSHNIARWPMIGPWALATMLRAATFALTDWRRWLVPLRDAAATFLSIRTIGSGTHWMSHWRTAPLAFYLDAACTGRPFPSAGTELWQPPVQVVQAIPKLIKKLHKEIDALSNKKNLAKQTFLENHLLRLWYPGTLFPELKRRLPNIRSCVGRTINTALATQIQRQCQEISSFEAFAVMRTLFNGWNTSTRLGEVTALHCAFGCGQTEEVDHYISCPYLIGVMRIQCHHSVGDNLLVDFLEDRPHSGRRLAVASAAYHTLAHADRARFCQMVLSRQHRSLRNKYELNVRVQIETLISPSMREPGTVALPDGQLSNTVQI